MLLANNCLNCYVVAAQLEAMRGGGRAAGDAPPGRPACAGEGPPGRPSSAGRRRREALPCGGGATGVSERCSAVSCLPL